MATTTEMFVEFLQQKFAQEIDKHSIVTDVLKAPEFPSLDAGVSDSEMDFDAMDLIMSMGGGVPDLGSDPGFMPEGEPEQSFLESERY